MDNANCKKCKYYLESTNWFLKLFLQPKCKFKPIIYTDRFGKYHSKIQSFFKNKRVCPY